MTLRPPVRLALALVTEAAYLRCRYPLPRELTPGEVAGVTWFRRLMFAHFAGVRTLH